MNVGAGTSMFVRLFCVAIVFALAAPCAAQVPVLGVAPGERIRILRVGESVPQDARLVSLGRDGLIFRPGGCCVTDTAVLSSITRIDVSRGAGIDPGRVAEGMAFGGLAGASVGWLVGALGCRLPGAGELCGVGTGVWMAILGAGGVLTGALWGIESKSERWERVYPPVQASLLVTPAPNHGVAFGVAIHGATDWGR